MSTEFVTATATGTDGHDVAETAGQRALDKMSGDHADFCQVFCSPVYDTDAVVEGIQSVIGTDVALIGCTSAGEFTEAGTERESVSLAVVSGDSYRFFTGFATGLSEDVSACLQQATAELPTQVPDYPYLSAINLHDGLTGAGEQIALATQRALGQHVGFAGGSAGDDMEMSATQVICNDQIAQDAVAIALVASKEPIPITANHGHEPISDSFEVTHAEDNVVYELDGRPAFDVWKAVIDEHAQTDHGIETANLTADDEAFDRLLSLYEFGIDQGNGFKIRWPGLTGTTDGPMEFAVSIPEGTVFRVMHSPPDDQIQSAVAAVTEAREALGDRDVAGAFIYDCVCRSAILGDEFEDSIDALAAELNAPLLGFETYGEMCMQRGQIGGYHNTTSAVFLLPE
jgi:methyl-accepting chemotaxis protein